MTQEVGPEGHAQTGHVKWFDQSKGFGFIVSDAGGPDILLHVNVLRNFGQSSVTEGSLIEVTVQRTDRGLQAVTINWIRPPEHPVASMLADLADLDPEMLARQPLEPARVKWFDKAKGFGFANVFGREEDVFVHIVVLRKSSLSDLLPGEAVGLRVIDGKRGRIATEVLAWDAPLR